MLIFQETQTTITPLADEILDVVVEVRYYPPLTDTTGTVTLNGIDYDYIIRAASITNVAGWGEFIGNKIIYLISYKFPPTSYICN